MAPVKDTPTAARIHRMYNLQGQLEEQLEVDEIERGHSQELEQLQARQLLIVQEVKNRLERQIQEQTREYQRIREQELKSMRAEHDQELRALRQNMVEEFDRRETAYEYHLAAYQHQMQAWRRDQTERIKQIIAGVQTAGAI